MALYKTVLVTGASAGFGFAICEKLASQGYKVIATARRQDKLDALANKYEGQIFPLKLDVTDTEAVDSILDKLPDEFKNIDVLVNNAGLALDQVFHSHFLERIHRRSYLLVAGQAEASQSDVSDSRTNHIRCIHRGYRNLIALYLEGELVLDATAHNGKIHRGSLRTAKAFHDFLLAHLHTRNSRIIHRNDAVAGYDSHLLGRTIHYGLDDEQGIIYHALQKPIF